VDALKSIVVGIDFSASSGTALAQGARIAGLNTAALHAVHVVDTLLAIEAASALSPMVKGIEDALIAEARQCWETFARGVDGSGAASFEVAVNNETVGVLECVRRHRADLLILGVGDEAAHAGPGTLAARCVRRAPCEVLLVRGTHAGPFKHIVACLDFSDTSGRGLAVAARIAAQDAGKVTVLHAYREPWKQHRLGTAPVGAGFEGKFVAGLRERVGAFLGRAAIDPSTDVRLVATRNHGAAIVDFARTSGADLVVLGTRGQGNLREFLMGSTAERVVRDAPCSVLGVKPADQAM
jgi:nucleotide-binding universal stress UspA family protein